jgi:hypothetical protein
MGEYEVWQKAVETGPDGRFTACFQRGTDFVLRTDVKLSSDGIQNLEVILLSPRIARRFAEVLLLFPF